jgi:hypothetical protein
MHLPQRFQVADGDLELRIQQRAIDVEGEQTEGQGHASSLIEGLFGIVLPTFMLGLYGLLGVWGYAAQAIAIIHFIRRRPDNYWLWIIIIGGGLGAFVYIAAEVIPDMGLLRGQFDLFSRRRRLKHMEAMVIDNPSAGNFEELGDLYLDDKKYQKAKAAFDRAISARTDSAHPFYRRAQAELELGLNAQALADLEEVVRRDPKHDFLRAQGLLAHAYALNGNAAEAERWFRSATETSTISETLYNYAQFLKSQGRNAEARLWVQKVIDKKATLPGYLKRRERPWFRKAASLKSSIPKSV